MRDFVVLERAEPAGPYGGVAELPADAVDTGYRRGDDQRGLAPDRSIVYLVTPEEVEARPSTTGPVGYA